MDNKTFLNGWVGLGIGLLGPHPSKSSPSLGLQPT
jgi:hypothetical protein